MGSDQYPEATGDGWYGTGKNRIRLLLCRATALFNDELFPVEETRGHDLKDEYFLRC
ncbi:MAG: hypothetical protein CM15mP71_5750 [Candidatus Poseidoniales archaeon]|nr:MAG: hypothetical protein CM15mP71_5750 [Candidatus Poseidoniales archaeon]